MMNASKIELYNIEKKTPKSIEMLNLLWVFRKSKARGPILLQKL